MTAAGAELAPWIAAHAAFLGILLVRNIVTRFTGTV